MDPRLSNPVSVLAALALGTPTFFANSLHRPHAVAVKPVDLNMCGLGVIPVAATAATGLPQRPDPSILNEAIPLFYIGQNLDGFWVARDANGQVGGIFLRKQSALNFANRNADPWGCATMFLSERLELDIENKGNPLVAHFANTKRVLTRLVTKLTFFIGVATRRD